MRKGCGIRVFLSLMTNPFFRYKNDLRFCIELGYGTHLLKKTRTILKLSSLYGRENSKNTNKKEIVRVFWATVRVGLSMFRCRLDKDPTTKSSLGVLLCPQLKLCIRNFG